MRSHTAEEVIATAKKRAAEDYARHLPIHTDPDGTTWQVDKNPYCTHGARNDWQRGFDNKPAHSWEITLDFNMPYQLGKAMAELVANEPKKE